MHIKFLAHGTGSARAAAKYSLGEQDATGKPREGFDDRDHEALSDAADGSKVLELRDFVDDVDVVGTFLPSRSPRCTVSTKVRWPVDGSLLVVPSRVARGSGTPAR